jgi:hypothetical protein
MITRAKFMSRVQELLKEYVLEGEHQDGADYWNNFANLNEAVADFTLFVTEEIKEN